MFSFDDQSIVAQCTPKGSGALAIVRIAGIDARSVASKIARLQSPHKTIDSVPTHTIHYGTIISTDNAIIDTVLFLVMDAPHSFTGQNTIEITCHNNPFIVESIINCALQAGARLAHEGEFSKRAVLNNKIDLLQAESINDLIHANTQESLKLSLQQVQGTLSHHIARIEKNITKALAFSDASFEFIDEEDMEFGNQIAAIVAETKKTIAELVNSFDNQKQIREGYRIALIGSVNAGKSSLFNAILKQERAIVTNIAGTTRDVIEAGMYYDGNYWTLIDTAGLRTTSNVIEKEGIQRSKIEAQKADVILLVYDASKPMQQEEREHYVSLLHAFPEKTIVIRNKTDLECTVSGLASVEISASHKNDPYNEICTRVQEKIAELFATHGSSYLLNKRQTSLLKAIDQHLDVVAPLFGKNTPYELVSHHLKEALQSLLELTGKTISENAMDAVFREFCIGK